MKTQNNINQEKLSYLQTISSLPCLNQVLENNLDNRQGKKKVKFMNSNSSMEHRVNENDNTTTKHEDRRKGI
jgi:hypothetical protein